MDIEGAFIVINFAFCNTVLTRNEVIFYIDGAILSKVHQTRDTPCRMHPHVCGYMYTSPNSNCYGFFCGYLMMSSWVSERFSSDELEETQVQVI
jgi:hypothetical protein